MTPLMWAAKHNKNPETITALLAKTGANGRLTSSEGKTAFAYATENDEIKESQEYWDLNKARF